MATRALAYLIAVALTVAAIFIGGWTARGWRDASKREAIAAEEAKALARDDERRLGIAQAYTERLTLIETNYAAVPDWWWWFVAERGALRDVDVGPVGLCIWSAWNAATSPESCLAGQGADDVAATGQRPAGASDGEP